MFEMILCVFVLSSQKQQQQKLQQKQKKTSTFLSKKRQTEHSRLSSYAFFFTDFMPISVFCSYTTEFFLILFQNWLVDTVILICVYACVCVSHWLGTCIKIAAHTSMYSYESSIKHMLCSLNEWTNERNE